MSDEKPELFAVCCETTGCEQPLDLSDLAFARPLEDTVAPLESGESFFVDGAPITKEGLESA